MHPDANTGLFRNRADPSQFLTAALWAMPRIDSMHANLASGFEKPFDPLRNLSNVVRGGPAVRMPCRDFVSGSVFERNQKVSRWKILFDFEIPFKWIPEILRPSQMDEWQGKRGLPVPEKAAKATSASEEIVASTDGTPIKKAPHGMIELVPPNSEKIDIMSETNKEVAAGRDGWDFDKAHAGSAD